MEESLISEIEWTNPSVKQLAGSGDPVATITAKVRALILEAMDDGWQGPPFDPILLAQKLGLRVIPKEDVPDARLSPKSDGMEIEYNPNKSKTRIRFSIAHEIGHTLFPDHNMSIHNRLGKHQRIDDWQLELLCNIAAAEILMPVGQSMDQKDNIPITIDKLIEIQKKYDASMEAVLLRFVKLTKQPITIFAAAKAKDETSAPYRVDYVVNSSGSALDIRPGMRLPADSVLSECTAVGYTAKRREKWLKDNTSLDIECVGVPPYPESMYPRVLGIIRTRSASYTEPFAIKYLVGDATQPRGTDHKIIAHIVNDESKKWGRGFGLAISRKWPLVRTDFGKWVKKDPKNLSLGNLHVVPVFEDLTICSMIAQHGYGSSSEARIRYRALAKCLEHLSVIARERSATIHMPRIGTGYGGGQWDIISSMIDEFVVSQGNSVTVYDLPGRERPEIRQSSLDSILVT